MNKITQRVQLFTKRLQEVVLREANETRIAAEILIKLINFHFHLKKQKPTTKEIEFLKLHSLDLMKLIPMIIMFPTPIPYIEIAIALRAIGYDYLLPKKEGLELPKEE